MINSVPHLYKALFYYVYCAVHYILNTMLSMSDLRHFARYKHTVFLVVLSLVLSLVVASASNDQCRRKNHHLLHQKHCQVHNKFIQYNHWSSSSGDREQETWFTYASNNAKLINIQWPRGLRLALILSKLSFQFSKLNINIKKTDSPNILGQSTL